MGIAGLGSEAKNFVMHPPKIYNDTDFVSQHVAAAFTGQLPTAEKVAELDTKFAGTGVSFSKAIGQHASDVAPAADRFKNMASEVWSGLFLRFSDATFGMRLDGALNKQAEAIEGMSRAIQSYQETIILGQRNIDQLQSSMAELSKMIDKAKASGDNAAVERLTQSYTVRETAVQSKTAQLDVLKKSMNDLAGEQAVLRLKQKDDFTAAEALKEQQRLNKDLGGLDDKLRAALDKFTNLESDISRIQNKTAAESAKATDAARILNSQTPL